MNTLALPISAVGAPPKQIHVEVVREITREDLPRARHRETAYRTIDKLRNNHHYAAILIAAGKAQWDVAQLTGFSLSRLQVLLKSPAFVELVEEKRKDIEIDRKVVLMDNLQRHDRLHTLALETYLERLEEEPEKFSNAQLHSIITDEADRLGPAKRQVNINANFDFADRLAAARKKMFGDDAKLIPEQGSPSLEQPGTDRRLVSENQ